ncbi:tripartite tricarboxylate transporter TctB family protein [Sinorhizobium psoraleae]|uniref:Tripartite tricarboxylate transporter TctB family protein n=1 Tax=Sinorhizobium psoraleae TaxID=520838 RepID=A0ABT4KB15_9HYPH|nr:tripartite tricarboxylate transporter TctB family protein [Sinorhizobium psoraleae]MCZ4089039.1 tripartite tricarboxylate transporter TctB family protein [Sinorhizobium psoraleae]
MKHLSFSTWLTIVMLAFFIVMVGLSMEFPAKARFMPLIVGLPAIALCLVQLGIDLMPSSKSAFHSAPRAGVAHQAGPEPELPEFGPHTVSQEILMWTYFVAFVAAILAFGFYASVPVLLVTFLRREAEASWRFALALAAAATLVLYLMFGALLHIQLHPGFVTPWLVQAIGIGAA